MAKPFQELIDKLPEYRQQKIRSMIYDERVRMAAPKLLEALKGLLANRLNSLYETWETAQAVVDEIEKGHDA